jgi:two-component system cell cycle sensor histidine kinase/response regulator CckA
MHTTKISRTILVVDDEAPILDCIRRILEHADYVVLTSPSGDHALDVIARAGASIDLVLTDIVMPGSIDGRALAAKMGQREVKLPVLFMTGASLEDDEYLADIAKKELLLRKPFSPKELLEFIDLHLDESRLPAVERAAIL